jgi:hypothetical protein
MKLVLADRNAELRLSFELRLSYDRKRLFTLVRGNNRRLISNTRCDDS